MSHSLFAQASVVAGSVTTSKTATYVPGVGNNRLLVVSISGEAAGIGNVSGVTWGGQPLTQAVNFISGTANRVSIWYLKETGIVTGLKACSYNFAVTWTATAPTNEVFAAYTLTNVDQTTPIPGGTSTNTGEAANAGSIALPAVTPAGPNDIVCYASVSNNNRTHTAPSGYTELSDQRVSSTTAMATAAKQITATGNESPTATWAGGNSRLLIAGVVFNGVTHSGAATYYSLASGAWDLNTSWSFSADGSSGAVPVGVWPERPDNVVIRTGHNITINAVNDNKFCGISPDALGRANVGPVLATALFYQTGDILINGTLTVTGVGIMVEGYTRITSGGTFTAGSTLVNLGYLETDAAASLSISNDLILTGTSATFFNSTVTVGDDLIMDFTTASLCGSGIASLTKTLNGSSQITYVHGATVAQICSPFQVTCTAPNCIAAPATGTGTVLQGNSGPGGVGNNTNNKLWLRANDLSLDNGAAVASWNDVSGNSLTASNATAAERPTFVTPSVNGLPSLSFDGLATNGDNLSLGAPAALNFIPQTDSWSFLIIYRSPANGATTTPNQGTLFSKAWNTTNRNYQYQVDDISGTASAFASYIGNGLNGGAVAINTNAWFISCHTNNTATKTSWTNETANFTGVAIAGGADATTEVLIGARRDTGPANGTEGFLYTGDIAEIMMYNRELNTAQRIIVSNYLSAKYAITLSANEVYTMDLDGNSNYDFEVAGIGQASDGSNHRDGKGSGIVRMWNPSNLGNNEFLMWGHDGTVLYSSTASGVGAPVEERLSRTWRVDKSGDVGTVSVSFDLSLLGTPLGSNLRLLIDRNGVNGFADNDVTPIAGSFVGNTVIFADVNFQDGDRFTLGNTDIDDPLPVELISFTAKAEKRMVNLNWSTALETNNDFFTVERSKNAYDWEVVQQVPGAGTTQKENHYEVVDDGPYSGASYYRLKQTDFDLQSKYSDLVRVVVDHETPVVLYPNPFQDRFRIVTDFEPERSEVRLYNSSGVEIPLVMKKEGEELIIEPGNVPEGLYLLKVLDRFVTRTIKVVKVQTR